MNSKSVVRDDRVVNVGSSNQVSMQVLQDIYHEITGKTEKLSRTYKESQLVAFDDICQLDAKIRQLYEQYHIVSSNCCVTIYHVNDSKERYSSFDRFKLYDRSSVSAVENVTLEYKFLIVLPKIDRPQAYKIEVNLHSRVGVVKRNSLNSEFNNAFFHFITSQVASVEVEYVDYTVARNFQTAIDGWIQSLDTNSIGGLWTFAKRFSDYVGFSFKNITAIIIAASFYFTAKPWFVFYGDGTLPLFYLSLLAFTSVYVGSNLAFKLGLSAQKSIDRYQAISYVKLNRGDEIAIAEFAKDERSKVLRILLSVGVTVLLNVSSSWLFSKLLP